MDKQEIQQECKKIFNEVKQLQNTLGWSDTKLYKETFIKIFDDEIEDEKYNEKKFLEKNKKIFQRKSWDDNKATNQTRLRLQEIRNAIYQCNDYKKSELHESKIPLDIRTHIQKESEELERFLKKKDYE